MTNRLRIFGLLAVLAFTTLGIPSASAVAGGFAFEGHWDVTCFGCGVSTGTTDWCVNGVIGTRAVACVGGVNVWASFTSNEPAGATCVITGSASGSTVGDINVDFNWTRVGATVMVTMSGDLNGAGTATFYVSSPLGNPCGGPVRACVSGTIFGTASDGNGQAGVGAVPLGPGCGRGTTTTVETDSRVLALFDSYDPMTDGPTDTHDLSAVCAVRTMKQAGTLAIAGRTHAGRHPSASESTIRCRLEDAFTHVVLFDQSRTEAGPQARLEGVVAAAADRVVVCARGEGRWNDGHGIVLGLTCRAD